MDYITLNNNAKMPILGFGMMRLPCPDGDDSHVDEREAFRLTDYAIEQGVNYFDTAWMYHGGRSEEVTGRCLNRHPRDSFYLATKFPGYVPEEARRVEKVFETQLRHCGVDYFDFYLLHNVYEKSLNVYLDDETYGILPYLLKQKANGRIRHLGFSSHGTVETMQRFLEHCGDKMEFCQIQLNYLDWHFQEAEKKVALLNRHHLPIWVMEPLRGGRLAALPPADTRVLKALRPKESIPAWSFRFLQSVPGVTVVLSGMSDMAQLKENILTFSEPKPLSDAEKKTLISIADRMTSRGGVPCTGCRYCVSYCPLGLNIPYLLAQYNEHRFTDGGWMAEMMIDALPEDKRPAACLGCRNCETVCPQQIRISEILAKFGRTDRKPQP